MFVSLTGVLTFGKSRLQTLTMRSAWEPAMGWLGSSLTEYGSQSVKETMGGGRYRQRSNWIGLRLEQFVASILFRASDSAKDRWH